MRHITEILKVVLDDENINPVFKRAVLHSVAHRGADLTSLASRARRRRVHGSEADTLDVQEKPKDPCKGGLAL
jgi:hypothetical protein